VLHALTGPALPTERVVDLTAADGTNLKATFFPAAKPGPGVLLLHQCNRQRKVWDPLARQLSAAGINVLTFDLRGFGESGGEPFDKLTPQQRMQLFQQEFPSDIDTAFAYLVSQPGVKREVIGVGGASCGVGNSIAAATRHPEVKSLVSMSGNTDLKGRNFLRSSSSPPAFFAIADDDEFPPSLIAIEWMYYLDANPGKVLARYAKGGHGADMFAVHPELITQITDWYVTTLIKTPGQAPAPKELAPVPEQVKVLEQIDLPGGADKVGKQLEQARQKDANAKLFDEAIVNFMGYEHLQAGETQAAVEIFKLNTLAYPDSPNTYDSLADGYIAAGQKDLALQSAKKALELLPTDTTDNKDRRDAIRESSEQKVKQLSTQTQ
jgi:dienelactone hydrolase